MHKIPDAGGCGPPVQSLDREDSQDGEDNANGGANNGGSGNGAAHAAEQAAAAQPLQRQRRRAAGMRVKLEPSSDGARFPAACKLFTEHFMKCA